MNTQHKKGKFLIALLFISALFLLPYIVMLLWNGILPEIIGVKNITYWQAVGIFILCKLLFGGFKRGGNHHHKKHQMMKKHFKNCCNNNDNKSSMKEALRDKFMNMSDEERENFRQKWKDRFRGRC
ncbi:hypothetical protein [Cloacibacterium sp.]|uniref:hypothetical protein n=1 Tax=Cloacibacterium sp. TaxID=1913682 RepID=UPI0039E3B8A7